MKKIFLIPAILLSIALAACGGTGGGGTPSGGTSQTEQQEQQASYPEGLFKIAYVSDENAQKIEELDTIEWEIGVRKVTFSTADFLNFMQVAAYLEINGDGSGVEYGSEEPIPFTIEGDTVFFEDGREVAIKWEGDLVWLKEQESSWTVYERTNEATIELMREGKGGSVPLAEAKVGDLVCMGTYDTVPGNDKNEPIYWRVIDKQNGRLFLLSDKLLDSFAYDNESDYETSENVTWENSSVREFLNGDFIDACFTPEETSLIQTTHISNADSNEWLEQYWAFDQEPYSAMATQNHGSGPDTDDRVFLLSLEEVLRYFGEPTEPSTDPEYPFSEMLINPEFIAYVTYAVDDFGQGYYNKDTLGGAWMTRTLSEGSGTYSAYCVTYISGDGSVFNYFTNTPMFIRPAMWVEVPSE